MYNINVKNCTKSKSIELVADTALLRAFRPVHNTLVLAVFVCAGQSSNLSDSGTLFTKKTMDQRLSINDKLFILFVN